MSKLVIIGQSPAAHSAIRVLRAGDPDREITLISTDGYYPYDRALFPGFMSRKVKEKDLFCASEDFYRENRVEVILDKDLSRINFNRRRIFLADKVHVDYDALLITDAPQVRLPEIKGIRRQGVFHLARFDVLNRMLKQLTFSETVAVVPSSLRGIEAALVLREAGKEVVLVSSEERLLASVFGDALSDALMKLVEKSGLRVVCSNMIEDILGEGEVQAVRFKSGKVMACEMVVFEEVHPDLRFMAEGDLLMQERICAHTTMRTNIIDVYAVDAVMEFASPKFIGSYSMDTDDVIRQGECAAKGILGQEEHFQFNVTDLAKKLESVFPIEVLAQT